MVATTGCCYCCVPIKSLTGGGGNRMLILLRADKEFGGDGNWKRYDCCVRIKSFGGGDNWSLLLLLLSVDKE